MKKDIKKKQGIRKETIIIIVLAILLVATTGYFIYDKVKTKYAIEQEMIFKEGMQIGFDRAISSLMQQAVTCNPVKVGSENISLSLIAVECLQQAQQQAQIQTQSLGDEEGTTLSVEE